MSPRRTTEIALQALALVAAVSAIAGCGGSGSSNATAAGSASAGSTTTGASSSSKPAAPAPSASPSPAVSFAGRAEAICGRRGPEVEAARAPSESLFAIAAAAQQRAAIERAGLGELDALAPPRTMDAQWKPFLADAAKVVDYLQKLGDLKKLAAPRGDRGIAGAITLMHSYERARSRLHAAAVRASLSGCAQYG